MPSVYVSGDTGKGVVQAAGEGLAHDFTFGLNRTRSGRVLVIRSGLCIRINKAV